MCCKDSQFRSKTMGSSEIPGYVPPWVSGGGGVGGRQIDPNDLIGTGGGLYDDFGNLPTPSQGPQTMAQALNPTPQPLPAVPDGTLNLNIDQNTLLIAAAVAIGLLIFAAK